MVAQGVMTARLRARFGERVEGGVGLDLEEHVGRSDELLAVGAVGSIAEEAVHSGNSSFSGSRLERGESSSLGEERRITSTSVVQQGADDLAQQGLFIGGSSSSSIDSR